MTECLSSVDPMCAFPARYALRDLELVEDIGVETTPFWPACESHAASARASFEWHIRTLQPHELETCERAEQAELAANDGSHAHG